MRLDLASLELQIVPVSQLRLHEDFDPWRAKRLVVSLRHQGILKNPLIVTGADGIFIVLDGATRTMALTEMGVPHALVQIVRYDHPAIYLQTWNHVLAGMPSSALLQELGRIPNLRSLTADLPELQAALAARRALVGVITGEHRAVVYTSRQSSHDQILQLAEVVAAYRGRAEVHRAAEVDMPSLLNLHPDLTAVVVFPKFTPDDVLQCASNQARLPMGITRHLIAGRALGIDVPLSLLASDRPLEEKNSWLQENLQSRIRHNKVRLYEEPTFVFDE
jgi:hypothetical protein